jgi:hypothetical protein
VGPGDSLYSSMREVNIDILYIYRIDRLVKA